MRGFLILLTILMLLFAVPLVARADEGDFLTEIRAVGFNDYDETLLRNGHTTCALHMQLGDDLTVRLIRRLLAEPEDRARLFLSVSKRTLC
jgi:hypothetical protein